MTAEWVDVIEADKVDVGCPPYTTTIKGHPIAIFNLEGAFYAIEDCCTHQGFPLSDGPIEGDEITCPFHGAKFCIKTGEVTAPPAFEDLPIYEVRIEKGIIQIKI